MKYNMTPAYLHADIFCELFKEYVEEQRLLCEKLEPLTKIDMNLVLLTQLIFCEGNAAGFILSVPFEKELHLEHFYIRKQYLKTGVRMKVIRKLTEYWDAGDIRIRLLIKDRSEKSFWRNAAKTLNWEFEGPVSMYRMLHIDENPFIHELWCYRKKKSCDTAEETS